MDVTRCRTHFDDERRRAARRTVDSKHAMCTVGVALLALTASVGTASARTRIVPLSHARLGIAPVVIHDRMLAFRGHRRARASSLPTGAYGGDFNTADGTGVSVYMSPSYTPDNTVLQSTANLFDGFVHDSELGVVTIYLAPIDEIHAACMSDKADSCIDPSNDTIYLVGQPPADGTPVEEIAAHEYGHAIALARATAWSGSAYNTGPEYWASYENVCRRTVAGTAFPGDEGAHYGQNPGEAWADTNRILNGGSRSIWQFDVGFFPNATDLRLAKQDILQEWNGNDRFDVTGTFHHYRARNQYYTLLTPHDGGDASIKLFTHGSLRANLSVSDAATGAVVGQSRNVGLYQAASFSICGGRRATIRVYRRSGYGSFTLRAYVP
jgi:hypothetical protein